MAATKIRFCWITAHDDRTEHVVTDDAQEASAGAFDAVCGVGFLPASMDIGADRRCPSCVSFLRARYTIRDLDARMTRERRPAWLSRLRCVGRSRGRHAA